MKKIITCLLVLLLIVGCSSRKSSGGDSYYAPASDSGVAYDGYDPLWKPETMRNSLRN